jgi:hypothetical protein
MKQQHSEYQVVPYPKIRRFLAAELRSSQHTLPQVNALAQGMVQGQTRMRGRSMRQNQT